MNPWKMIFPFLSPDDIGAISGGSELAQDLADLEGDTDNDDISEGSDDDIGDGDSLEGSEDGERDTSRRIPKKEEEDDEEEGDEKGEDTDDEEDEEKDEESDEEEAPRRIEGRPTIQQVKKLYPDLFKKIPYFRDMYFSDEKFRQHIADPEQAEEFVTKASHFDRLEGSLMRGDPEVLLTELKEGSGEAFKKVVNNFLPSLRKLDPSLYTELTLPVIEELLYHAGEYAKARGESPEGKNLMRSAEWLADFVFQNGGKIPDIKGRGKGEKHPAEIELERERERRNTELRTAAVTDVNGRIDKSLEGMVREGLGDGLNNFAKSAVIDRTLTEFINTLKGDKAFQMKLDSLWKAARAAGFSEAAKAQISNAYVMKGRQMIRAIRSKYVAEAQGGKRRFVKREDGKEETTEKKQEREKDSEDRPRKRNFDAHGRSARIGTRRDTVLDSRKIDYSRTSDDDILSGDPARVKLKGQR